MRNASRFHFLAAMGALLVAVGCGEVRGPAIVSASPRLAGPALVTYSAKAERFSVWDEVRGCVVATNKLESRGLALPGAHGVLQLFGGAFMDGDDTVGTLIAAQCKARNAFCLELGLEPAKTPQAGPAVIFAIETKSGEQNLAVTQEGDRVFLLLATADTNAPAAMELFALDSVEPVHLAIVYASGALKAYRNGVPLALPPGPAGALTKWAPGACVIGNDRSMKHPWRGGVDRFAVFAGELTAKEIGENHRQWAEERANRPAIPRLKVQARLVNRPQFTQTLENNPYRHGYMLNRYEVQKVLEGQYSDEFIIVAQWLWIDRRMLTTAEIRQGQSFALTLEPLAAHPEVDAQQLASDTADVLETYDEPIYVDLASPEYDPEAKRVE